MADWTFEAIKYERPDPEAIKQYYIDAAAKLKTAKSYAEFRQIMLDADEYQKPFETMFTVAYIRNTLDTQDEFYEKEIEYLNDTMPTLQPYFVAFSEALYDSSYKDEMTKEYGQAMFSKIELQRKSFCEKNIPLMQREAKLTTEYQKIMAGCAIEFEGQTLNLYGIQKYFEDADRDKRQRAVKAYSDFYLSNEQRLEEIWDELIKVRNEMGRNLGFDDFIPLGYMRQGRTDYGQAEVASFRDQVRRELVPLCKTLYEYQAKRLGVDELMFWDEKRIYKDGNAHPAGDDDFMIARAKEMYHKLSPETGEFIDYMISHNLMDLKNKPRKASTGYQTDLSAYKAPFVFSCFNGTIFDMQVLTHELGHAFNAYLSMRCQPISDYYGESTDIAEIHSMAMEQFSYPYAEMFFGDDADKFRFAHLQEAVTFVPFGVAVDEFQHICYAHPELTPKERTMEWHKLEQKYLPWRKYGDNEFYNRGGWWYHKLHIYLYPMYYINYTLTTMGALEFKYKDSIDHQKAWSEYLRLCACGGSKNYLDTLAYANVTNPFLEGSVAKCTDYAKQILLKQVKNI